MLYVETRSQQHNISKWKINHRFHTLQYTTIQTLFNKLVFCKNDTTLSVQRKLFKCSLTSYGLDEIFLFSS